MMSCKKELLHIMDFLGTKEVLLIIITMKKIFLTLKSSHYIMGKIRKRDSETNDDMSDSFLIVPPEIDTHLQIYGKHMWEVTYYDRCPLCEKRMDEFGFCACNSCSG